MQNFINQTLKNDKHSNGTICFSLMSYEEAQRLNRLPGNRGVTTAHINDFVKILKNTKFDDNIHIAFKTSLIIINEKNGHIIDGQHRHAAFLKAIEDGIIPKDSCLVVCPLKCKDIEEEFAAVQAHNEKTKNWTLNDYITAYATQNEDYQKLEKFCKEHELCHGKKDKNKLQFSYGIAIIGGIDRASAKYGNFTVTDDQLAIAHNVHEELVALRHCFGLGNDYTIVPMANTWRKYRHAFSMADVKKYELPSRILQMPRKNNRDWDNVFSSMQVFYEQKRGEKKTTRSKKEAKAGTLFD